MNIRIAVLILATVPLPAAPAATVSEVLEACVRSAGGGGQGIDGAFCEWYALPCACKIPVHPAGTARWCYPEPMDHAAALADVLVELRSAPGQAPADAVVPPILARLFPCSDASAAGIAE